MKILNIILIASLLIFTSCKDEDRDSGGGGTVIIDTGGRIPDEYTDPPSRCEVSTDETSPDDSIFRPIMGDGNSRVCTPSKLTGKCKWSEYKKFSWKAEYSDDYMSELKKPEFSLLLKTKLPKDELKLVGCPKFNSMSKLNKMRFWTLFFAANSRHEGGHHAKAYMDEKGTGDSYGLQQVDSRGCNSNARVMGLKTNYQPIHRGTKYSHGGDMYDTSKNIRCSVIIMTNQVRKGLGLFTTNSRAVSSGKKSYWATMRYGRSGHKKLLKSMNSYINQVPACNSPKRKDGYGEKQLALKQNNPYCEVVQNKPRGDGSEKGNLITAYQDTNEKVSKSISK